MTETLGRESLLTSQVLSSLGSTFQNTVGEIGQANSDYAGAITAITNSDDNRKQTEKLANYGLYAVVAIAGVFLFPKLVKAFKG